MELSGIPIPHMNWESDNLPETWSNFCEHCALITSGPLKDKEESVKSSYSQLWIGEKGREIIKSLDLGNAEKKKVDTVSKRIKDYLQPKVNAVFARYQFYNIVQTWFTVADHPFQICHSDLFEWENKTFIVVTDSYSRFFEVIQMSNSTSSTVIHHMKAIFSRHGIPNRLISDNGPCYASQEFAEFMTLWDIQHVTSSPHYSQGNPLAEKTVQTVKRIFSKAKTNRKDPYNGLLEYRATKLDCGYSPAELLYGRQIRSVLPVRTKQLIPKLPTYDNLRKDMTEIQEKSKNYYDRGSKSLNPLSIGDQVRVQMPNKKMEISNCS